LPYISPVHVSQLAHSFLKRVGPILDIYKTFYNFFTIRSKIESLLYLVALSLAILNFEQIVYFFPLIPLSLMVFIFHNLFMNKQYRKPEVKYIESMRICQLLVVRCINLIDLFEEIKKNYFYWKFQSKTIFCLKLLSICTLMSVLIPLVKIRILILTSLWSSVGMNSPFLKIFFKSILSVVIDYGIHLEMKIYRIIKNFGTFNFYLNVNVI